MILFKEDAILASSISKFGEWKEPWLQRDEFKSTISTSLIHNIASERKSEQERTWVLNLTFQHENVEGVGKFFKNEAPTFAVFAD